MEVGPHYKRLLSLQLNHSWDASPPIGDETTPRVCQFHASGYCSGGQFGVSSFLAPHRISVRAICTKGQSKDAQCTLVVGKGMTATPGRLRATQIGTKSAKLSWIPGNSNFWHRVYLNQYEIHTCPPGVYKILLTDLTPDTLHRVCVQAVPQSAGIPEPQESPPIWINNIRSGVDTKNLAAFIEFRTLPIGLPDPPTHVQLEPGPQDDMLLVTWVPVPQDARAAADAKAAGATSTLPVQGYTVCLNDQVIEEVDGASNDHAILSLKHLKDHLERTLGLFQSPPFHGALNYPSSENYPDIPTQFYSPPADDHSQPLFITVHSTVPASSVGQGIDLVDAVSNGSRGKNFDILKGSGGPGSLPVCLTPEILVACAGSLEAAVRVFGERLSQQLGINEQSATRAGVPLRLTVEGPSSPAPTTQSDHTTGMEAGLVTVSADASARKPNPTADAIGSAEYRSQPSSSVMTSVPEIRVQPDPARHGPTRPSRSRYMNNYTPSEDHRRVTSQAPTGPPSNEFRQARASSPAINPMTSGSRYASVIRNPSAQTLDLTASRHPGVYSSNAVRPRPGLPVDATGEYVSSRGKTQPTQMPQSRQTQSPPQVMAQTKGFHQSVGKGLTMLPGESGPHQPVNDTRPMRMVIALYDYDPAIMSPNPDAAQEELPFREGQVIKIFGECDEDGFFWGECNGLRGLVPSNMVSKPDREPNTEPAAPRTDRQIAYDRRYANATESTALPPGQLTRPRASEQTQRPLNPPLSHYESARKFGPPSYADTRKPGPPPPNEPMVQISSAYESRLLARPSHPSEIGSSNLNVREYDDTQRPGGYSRPPTNTSSLTDYPDTGQRPHNYRRQPGTEAMSMSTPVISERISQAPIARCMVAIYDYDPQLLSPNADAEMELSFQTGDQITVYGEMDEDGFYSGELADGRRGLVPSNFLRELPGGSERQVQRSLMIRDNRNRVSQRSLEPNEKGSGNSERAQNHAKETNQQYLLSAPQAENYTEDQRLQNKPMPSTNLPRVSSNVQKDSDIPYRAGNNQDGEQRPLHYPLGRNSFQRE
ncbi:unnamed protein product [Calicophoron daubneyi]|uniref:SH3 domain-containing protein n=1 Tax=Calicophoron daubneyi TaxID=300641 RepID=A0AAV2TEH8_CALDB